MEVIYVKESIINIFLLRSRYFPFNPLTDFQADKENLRGRNIKVHLHLSLNVNSLGRELRIVRVDRNHFFDPALVTAGIEGSLQLRGFTGKDWRASSGS